MDPETTVDLISSNDSLHTNVRTPTSDCDQPVSDGPDADEYARNHGLSIDSLNSDPWKGLLERDDRIAVTLIQTDFGDLIESERRLEELAFRSILEKAEQWSVSAESLTILQQVCKPCTDREVAAHMAELCFTDTGELKKLKVEQPALRSDHQADCRRLERRVKAFQKVLLEDHHLPLHPVDVEQGEGLKFPESARKGDEALMNSLSKETIEVTKDTLMFLVQGLKADWSDDEQRELMEDISTYTGLNRVEYVTPPLSPRMQPEQEYFVPDDQDCAIPILSDPNSSLSTELEALEGKILSKDNNFWSDIASQQPKSPDRYDDIDISGMIRAGELSVPKSPSSSPELIPRDFKIEVPLLPDDSIVLAGNVPSRVLLPEDLEVAKNLMTNETIPGEAGVLDGRLNEFFEETATRVMRTAEQEQLQPLDATARVTTPVMDFSMPLYEWDEQLWTPQVMFEWIQKTTHVDWKGLKWQKNNLKEQKMVWAPLAHMAEKQLIAEAVEVVPNVLAFFLDEPREAEIQTSADFVHTQPGMLFLRRNENDEDEILEERPREPSASPPSTELVLSSTSITTTRPCSRSSHICQAQESIDVQTRPSISPSTLSILQPQDLSSLLRGKKRQLELFQRHSSPVAGPLIRVLDATNQDRPSSTNVLRGFESEYTDFRALVENFVEMNMPKKAKLRHSRFINQPALPQPQLAAVSNTKPTEPKTQPAPAPIPALSPDIVPPKAPPRIIMSAAVSNIITSHLEKLLIGIGLIERDYERLRPEIVSPGSKQPNCDEADFVLSPATGIIITTMVKLRQKPLPVTPGQQQQQPTFRNVVENVAMRHERLIVLISEGNKHSETMNPLSQSDAKALAEFQCFAGGLQAQTDVHVFYVGGGTETLAKWVAAMVCNYGTEAEEWQSILLPVETGWELFLRRAGMNVFAAQVVLGMLKVPDDEFAIGGKEGKLYGLPAFLMMSRDERAEKFADIFGGRRLLDRVGTLVDESWGDGSVMEMDNGVLSQDKEVVDVFSDDIEFSDSLGPDEPKEQFSDGFSQDSSPWE
ncbi:hypothetical protein SMACR_04738 [Sordaria macrospora]|uniref:WGS project CABT00000000 data, contig 2.21 n=2 Tax=Sordaria macrospora TaxID=5147 RepID=F7W2A6_SORMK|nr:uncharacterized protein SMAC_04738 [Sordaria macrospora k-hell]KAA8636745.1 hypothetical protein SMACR_04738 [Sordaria macrospora]WPJ62013.1 hypothetical protein SMAC4_04738 [Sordaria macrospora]CCC11756.1 unnamed protein product [Sordaria macrospora k-hell]